MAGESRFEPLGGGGGSKAPDFPRFELKIIYDCQLCKTKHTAVINAKGTLVDAEMSRSYMDMAKKDLLHNFFTAHSKAVAEDFDLERLSAMETITYGSDEDPEVDDKLGVPMTIEEVREFREEPKKAKTIQVAGKTIYGDEKSKTDQEKEPIEKAEEESSLNTGNELPMSFDKIEMMVQKRLEELGLKEKALISELSRVQQEIAKFAKMAGDAADAKAIEEKQEEE